MSKTKTDTKHGIQIDTRPVDHSDLQQTFDEASAKGYFGETPDPTPDENYSLLTPQDAPTPETDADLHAQAREASHGNPRTAIDRTAMQVASDSRSNSEPAEEERDEAPEDES